MRFVLRIDADVCRGNSAEQRRRQAGEDVDDPHPIPRAQSNAAALSLVRLNAKGERLAAKKLD